MIATGFCISENLLVNSNSFWFLMSRCEFKWSFECFNWICGVHKQIDWGVLSDLTLKKVSVSMRFLVFIHKRKVLIVQSNFFLTRFCSNLHFEVNFSNFSNLCFLVNSANHLMANLNCFNWQILQRNILINLLRS